MLDFAAKVVGSVTCPKVEGFPAMSATAVTISAMPSGVELLSRPVPESQKQESIGDSGELSRFEEVFYAVDEMGIVYYDIVDCNGDLYMIWSNSERFPDKIVRGVLQGKDTLYCSLLAEKTEGVTS